MNEKKYLVHTSLEFKYDVFVTSGDAGYNLNYLIRGIAYSFYYHFYPTDNCQLGSYGSLESILKSSNCKNILEDFNKAIPKIKSGYTPKKINDC